MERAKFEGMPLAVAGAEPESNAPRWRVIAGVSLVAISATLAGNQTAQSVMAEEAPAPVPAETTAETTVTPTEPAPIVETEMEASDLEHIPKPKPKPKTWKYSYAKPSHGPLRPMLQRQLNSITPPMYRKMKKIGDGCEGRRGLWRKDNGRFGGGLNITDANWNSTQFDGRDFARNAQSATPAEQMVVLMRIQAYFGWGVPNGCPLAQYGPWKPQYRIFKRR